MTKPKFTPDPPPYLQGMPVDKAFPLFVDWVIRQNYRIEDWWPKDFENRIQSLEALTAYETGTWPIVGYSNVILTDFSAPTPVLPQPETAWVDIGVISHCKFKDTEADTSAPISNHCVKSFTHPCYFLSLNLWMLPRFCDFDVPDLGSDAGYIWRGNVTSPERELDFAYTADEIAVIASGYELGYWKNYINPLADELHSITLTQYGAPYLTSGDDPLLYGTSQYDGSDPVPNTNPYGDIIEVSPGTGNIAAAVAAASDGDILILKSGTHVISQLSGNGIEIRKNIRIYGETEDPDDVLITNDSSALDWGGYIALLTWYLSSASPIKSSITGSSCDNIAGSIAPGVGFSPGIFHVTYDTSPHSGIRVCFNKWLWGFD